MYYENSYHINCLPLRGEKFAKAHLLKSIMTEKKKGRPPVQEHDRKKVVPVRLSERDIAILKKAHGESTMPFSAFIRERLMNNKVMIIPKQLGSEIREEMRNILKLAGALNLIALRTSGDIDISDAFRQMTQDLRGIVTKSNFSASEKLRLVSIVADVHKPLVRLASLKSEELTEDVRVIVAKLYPLIHEYLELDVDLDKLPTQS